MRKPRFAPALLLALSCGLAFAAPAVAQNEAEAPASAAQQAAKARLATIELKGSLQSAPGPLDWLFGSERPTLRAVVNALQDIAVNDRYDGVLIRLRDAELSATQVEELGAAINKVRQAGKKVHVFSEAYGTTGLMLGAYADETIAQAGGPVSLPGLYMEEMFLADTLEWIGLKADFVQVGDYKGAAEQMSRNAPSREWDANINQLLDSLYANIRKPILKGRRLTDKKLDEAMETVWLADAKDAVRAGLIDAEVDLAVLGEHLRTRYDGRAIDWKKIALTGEAPKMDANPFAMMSLFTKEPDHKPRKPTIAVVHINGAIVDGDSSSGGLFGGEGQVGSRTIRKALEDVLKENLIKGVVVRIDSPGGSATASEVIWQGIRRVAEKKPVWVSVGDMAASGGYYCAVAGEKIYVNPSSIVGSIGVVGGKLSMQGLYDWAKVRVVPRARGPRASMFASGAPWSAQDIELVRAKMKQTYALFTSRVEQGRQGIDLSVTAEGRLFTGDKAIALKMADAVGGLDDCIAGLAKRCDLDDYGVMDYPAPRSLNEVLSEAFSGFGSARAPGVIGKPVRSQLFAAVRELVGERAWAQIEPSLAALLQLREHPVVLTSPRVLISR
jgi:protease-4